MILQKYIKFMKSQSQCATDNSRVKATKQRLKFLAYENPEI